MKTDKKIVLHIDQDGVLATWNYVNTGTLYETGYFANLEKNGPVPEGIEIFMRNYPDIEVGLLSSYLSDKTSAIEEKAEWLYKNMPYFFGHANLLFIPCGESKLKATEDDGLIHILLDDYSPNLIEFVSKKNNFGIKLLNGINGAGKKWDGPAISSLDVTPEDFSSNLYEIVNTLVERGKRNA